MSVPLGLRRARDLCLPKAESRALRFAVMAPLYHTMVPEPHKKFPFHHLLMEHMPHCIRGKWKRHYPLSRCHGRTDTDTKNSRFLHSIGGGCLVGLSQLDFDCTLRSGSLPYGHTPHLGGRRSSGGALPARVTPFFCTRDMGLS